MRIALLPFILLPVLIAHAEVVRLSEPVEVGEGYEVFGAPMPDKRAAPSLVERIESGKFSSNESLRVSTQIAQVCQKKGCFFIASEGDAWARVTFRDYGFFLPTDSTGKAVTLEGELSTRLLSPEEAAHYAADLGEDPDTAEVPGFEYNIVATSIIVYDSQAGD
ncbi:MAG: DUF4920 domain-containing protein [Pseudomonadota bacterium]